MNPLLKFGYMDGLQLSKLLEKEKVMIEKKLKF